MTPLQILERMISFSEGNIHDIDHFMRVWTYARTIGQMEGLAPETQFILEAAAITHDIACPLCRTKYGNTNGKLQETEGMTMISTFFEDTDLTPSQVDRIRFLVGHHHTYSDIDGADYQILLEADYIANAIESGYSHQSIRNFRDKIAKTAAGRRLIDSIFLI